MFGQRHEVLRFDACAKTLFGELALLDLGKHRGFERD